MVRTIPRRGIAGLLTLFVGGLVGLIWVLPSDATDAPNGVTDVAIYLVGGNGDGDGRLRSHLDRGELNRRRHLFRRQEQRLRLQIRDTGPESDRRRPE